MAKSRLYGWNGEMPEKAVSGQCLIVLNGLKARADEMHDGHRWAELIGGDIATKQDPYRVVLYYILILKGRGCIKTSEREIAAITKNGEVKHAVTVRTEGVVEERETIADQIADAEEADGDDDAHEVEDELDELQDA